MEQEAGCKLDPTAAGNLPLVHGDSIGLLVVHTPRQSLAPGRKLPSCRSTLGETLVKLEP